MGARTHLPQSRCTEVPQWNFPRRPPRGGQRAAGRDCGRGRCSRQGRPRGRQSRRPWLQVHTTRRTASATDVHSGLTRGPLTWAHSTEEGDRWERRRGFHSTRDTARLSRLPRKEQQQQQQRLHRQQQHAQRCTLRLPAAGCPPGPAAHLLKVCCSPAAHLLFTCCSLAAHTRERQVASGQSAGERRVRRTRGG